MYGLPLTSLLRLSQASAIPAPEAARAGASMRHLGTFTMSLNPSVVAMPYSREREGCREHGITENDRPAKIGGDIDRPLASLTALFAGDRGQDRRAFHLERLTRRALAIDVGLH